MVPSTVQHVLSIQLGSHFINYAWLKLYRAKMFIIAVKKSLEATYWIGTLTYAHFTEM